MRELSGAHFTAVEFYGDSLADVLAEAAIELARVERRLPHGVITNERGVPRLHHAEHEDGHQLIITFEGAKP